MHAENDGCTLFTRAFAEAVPKRAACLIRKLAAPLQEASSAEQDGLEHGRHDYPIYLAPATDGH